MRLHRPLPGEKEDRPSERGGRGLFQFPREVVEEEFVLQRLAEAYGVSDDAVAEATNAAAQRIFPLAFAE